MPLAPEDYAGPLDWLGGGGEHPSWNGCSGYTCPTCERHFQPEVLYYVYVRRGFHSCPHCAREILRAGRCPVCEPTLTWYLYSNTPQPYRSWIERQRALWSSVLRCGCNACR